MSKNNDMGFFSISIAEKYGLTCAVIYQSIRYWIDYNQANKKNFRDGCYWVYNSVSAWHELFPYLTEKQIRTAIEELEADNLIVSSNHNKRKYDRTKWYTIPEKSKIHLPHRANDVAPQGEPIPLITTENTNTLPNNSDELFGVAEDISQPQDKTGIPVETGTVVETGLPVETGTGTVVETGTGTVVETHKRKKEILKENGRGKKSAPESPTLFPSLENESVQKRNGGSGKKKTTIPGFHDMFNILAEICKLDINLVRGRIAGIAKSLIKAGYTVEDIKYFNNWWYEIHWRGKDKHQIPTLELIVSLMKEAKESSDGTTKKPEAPPVEYERFKTESGEYEYKIKERIA